MIDLSNEIDNSLIIEKSAKTNEKKRKFIIRYGHFLFVQVIFFLSAIRDFMLCVLWMIFFISTNFFFLARNNFIFLDYVIRMVENKNQKNSPNCSQHDRSVKKCFDLVIQIHEIQEVFYNVWTMFFNLS